ncbi:uncharacterized protein PG986_013161 [Apiospora aurea]|uniref:Rhodopsin domain-containing protein n=1 Tax=Apiospora aurea TaxID=335848 RepID=A0ABR1PV39_9PEZI
MNPASAAAMAAAKEREGDLFIQEVWGLTGTAIVFVILRYYARLKAVGFKGLTADDYLMFPATVVMSIESMAGYMVVAWWKGFANNAISDPDRATLAQQARLDPNGAAAEEMRDGVRNRRLLTKCSIIVLPATYIGCLLVAFLKCVPFDHHWQVFPNPGVNCMPAISPLQTIFVMVMNTVTDFYLMAIPVPMIWKSKLPLKKKLMIILMFSGAILEMIFGILRAVAILKDGDTNPAESGYWSIRESFVSFVLTNLPMVYPLFREYSNQLPGKTGSTTGKSTENSYQLSSYPRKSKNNRSRGPHTVPNEDITFDSKENICVGTLEHPRPRGRGTGEEDDGSQGKSKQEELEAGDAAGRAYRTQVWDSEAGKGGYQTSAKRSSSQRRPVDPRQRKPSSTQITITTEYTVSDGGKIKDQSGSAYAF